MSDGLIELARDFYNDEVNDHVTYRSLGERARNARLRNGILEIAAIEQRHSRFWQDFLTARGSEAPPMRLKRVRLRILQFLQRFIDPVIIISALELGEAAAYRRYCEFLRSAPLSEEERTRLRRIIVDELEHERFFKRESEGAGLAHVRDFVLGMNDGLVEILGAVTGLSAVYVTNPLVVAVSGFVVGIAGAMSMGIGAFVSVRSQRQVNQGQKERMEALFEVAPERAVEEYKEMLRESGFPDPLAAHVAKEVSRDRGSLARLLAPEVRENEARAGLLTGLAYLFAAGFPVLPYFLASNSLVALSFSVLLAGTALAVVATTLALLSGISIRRKISEMLLLGLGAAAVAYGFGRLMQSVFGIGL